MSGIQIILSPPRRRSPRVAGHLRATFRPLRRARISMRSARHGVGALGFWSYSAVAPTTATQVIQFCGHSTLVARVCGLAGFRVSGSWNTRFFQEVSISGRLSRALLGGVGGGAIAPRSHRPPPWGSGYGRHPECGDSMEVLHSVRHREVRAGAWAIVRRIL